MMKLINWNDLAHKATSEVLREERKAACLELQVAGLAAIRKAQQQTQVELAETLGLPQASISDIENRSDLLLSTLAKYVRALGGELKVTAVFPKASFQLASAYGEISRGEPTPRRRPVAASKSSLPSAQLGGPESGRKHTRNN